MTRRLPAPEPGALLGNFVCAGAPFSDERGRCIPVRCVCGKETSYKLAKLVSGHTNSCGCEKTKRFTEFATSHGMRSLPEYQVWLAMRQRCSNPKNRQYKDYGGRGIRVCSRWGSFEKFFEDMGPRPFAGATIERKKNNESYRPGNVVWATRKENARNKRNTLRFFFEGTERSVGEIAELTGVTYKNAYWHLKGKLK